MAGRLNKVQAFERTLKDAYGSKAVSTKKGYMGYEQYALSSSMGLISAAGYATAMNNDLKERFELPTRNHAIAYLVQEMVAVSSRLKRGIEKLASDASQDSEAASQPFTIIVNEENATTRSKILDLAQKMVVRTKLGYKGRMRLARALLTGDAIGQPVFELQDGRFHLSEVLLMPTWEMHYNPTTKVWKQYRADRVDGKPIEEWLIPDYMARVIHEEDDNYAYGRSILASQVINYRHYIMALEDLAVAARTRAPRRLAHYIGPEAGTFRIDEKALAAYKARNEAKAKTIITDYYIANGLERIEPIQGDAQGVAALLEVVLHCEKRMLADMGLPPEISDVRGRSTAESADTTYANRINQLRQEDARFVLDILRKGLLLEGYADIDLDIGIPSLGETPAVRMKRTSDAYHNSLISYNTWCANNGIKDARAERLMVEADIKWKDAQGIPCFTLADGDEDNEIQVTSSATGEPTEKPKDGADPSAGRIRRNQIQKEGRQPTGV